MEDIVKFYYGNDVSKYLSSWELKPGGIFFDTLNKLIYYNGNLYGSNTGDIEGDISNIETALGKIVNAFVSIEETEFDTLLIISFINSEGNTIDTITLPYMKEDSTGNLPNYGLIVKEDKEKLDRINPDDLVTKEKDHGLYPNDDKEKLANIDSGAQVNKIEEIKVDGTSLNIADKSVNIEIGNIIENKISHISDIYIFKGSVTNDSELPTTDLRVGDVYNIITKSDYGEAGVNVAWNGSDWDSLGGILNTNDITGDISGLEEKVETLEGNVNKINTNVSNLSDIIDLMNSDGDTDSEKNYSVSYKINTEILNALKWTEIK